ncbi:5812_t:CDS:2 [Entrophospora sp. SA101]|nr:5812_t:CDS:2 [Entrophospora sp. SA101]CAJ0829176.1 22296_t:CDS:2 [Entrophospora sp. SA101]
MLHKHNSSNNLSIIAGGNDNNGETRPLLSSNLDKTNPKYSPTTTTTTKWYKRPSYHWILPSFFLLSVTFGLAVTTKINFYLKVICREYYSAGDGVHNVDYDDESCNTSEISALTSQLLLKLSLFHSIPAIVVLGSLGSLSDRRGRRIVLLLPTIGGICISSCIILVDKYLYGNPFGTKLLLFGSFLDGLTGSYTSLVAVSHAYVTDCTEPGKRNIVFGWLMGSLYCGFSIGPMIAGWISQATGNIMSLSIFLPASKNNRNNEESKVLGRYALLNSAIITFFTSFAIYGIQAVFLLYISLVFKLSVVEQGYLLFVIGGARDLIEEESEESKLRLKGELLKLEIWVIRIGLFIEAACMTLYGIISSGVALIGVAVTASLGSTAFPTLKSFQTNLLQLHHQYVLIRCIVYLSPDLLHILYEEGGIGYEISDGEYVDDDDINVVIDVIDGPVVNWYWLEYD